MNMSDLLGETIREYVKSALLPFTYRLEKLEDKNATVDKKALVEHMARVGTTVKMELSSELSVLRLKTERQYLAHHRLICEQDRTIKKQAKEIAELQEKLNGR